MSDATVARPVVMPCAACGKLNRVDVARADAIAKCGTCHAPLDSAVVHVLTDANFAQVTGAASIPVVIDFYADWCGPCKMMAPVFAQLASRQRGAALVAKVDTDRSPLTASRFAVRSIPTIVVLRDGKEIARQVGAVPLGTLEGLLR